MQKLLFTALMAIILLCPTANADFVTIDMANWTNLAEFGNPGNSSAIVNIGAGSTITAVSYSNLQYTALGASWISDLALSVNNSDASVYWDWRPGNTGLAANDGPGTIGPLNGLFGSTAGQTANGSLVNGSTPGFSVLADGDVFVTIYDPFFKDNGDTENEAIIASGTLTVTFTAVPEPGALLSMLATGVVGVIIRRRVATGGKR